MSKFSVFFAYVSIFTFYALCMDPSDSDIPSPPAPKNVEFGDCFAVKSVAGPSLASGEYNYNHICPVKVSKKGSEKAWYIVGWLDKYGFETLASPTDYLKVKQSLIKFTYMRKETVSFNVGTDITQEYTIVFRSFQHSQAFYVMIYGNVNLKPMAKNKIGLLHEIIDLEPIKMDSDVKAVYEQIIGVSYITFKNEQGLPLLIFSQIKTTIMRVGPSQVNPQIYLRSHDWFYILTFSNSYEAEKFDDALMKYVSPSRINYNAAVKTCFLNNQITVDP